MGTSGLVAVILLMLLAVLYFFAVPKIRAHSRSDQIGAEIWANDVIEPDSQQAVKASAPAKKRVPVTEGSYRIRWGRLTIFGVAALALVTFMVTALVATFGSLNWGTPLVSLALSFAGLALLRYLAIQDQKKKAKNRSGLRAMPQESQVVLKPHTQHVRSAEAQKKETEQTTKHQTSDELSATRSAAKPAHTAQARPVTNAVRSLRYARTHEAEVGQATPQVKLPAGKIELENSLAPLESSRQEWAPREVPVPTYLDAPAAYREASEPKPEETTPASVHQTIHDAAAASTKINVDDALARRRA